LYLRVLWWVLFLALLGDGRTIANEPLALTISLSPVQSLAPANLRVVLHVARDARNGAVDIATESDSFFRSSRLPLEGDLAPRTFDLTVIGVPGGEYVVTASLLDRFGNERAAVSRRASVIAGSF
jgi:hypothetical protein